MDICIYLANFFTGGTTFVICEALGVLVQAKVLDYFYSIFCSRDLQLTWFQTGGKPTFLSVKNMHQHRLTVNLCWFASFWLFGTNWGSICVNLAFHRESTVDSRWLAKLARVPIFSQRPKEKPVTQPWVCCTTTVSLILEWVSVLGLRHKPKTVTVASHCCKLCMWVRCQSPNTGTGRAFFDPNVPFFQFWHVLWCVDRLSWVHPCKKGICRVKLNLMPTGGELVQEHVRPGFTQQLDTNSLLR